MIRRILFLFFPVLLAACGSVPAPPEQPVQPVQALPSPRDESRVVLEAIALAQRVGAATADEQRRVMASAAQALGRERTAAARLRYGILLALPALPGADPLRAAATLEPLSTAESAPVRQFATLLLIQLNERNREQKRAQQLKDQLDELRAIERSLIERGQPKK